MLNKNLKDAMNKKDISISELSTLSGVPVETIRNIYYQKVTDVKLSTASKLAAALNMSLDRLAGKSTLTEEEQNLIDHFRQCGIHGKGIISLIAKFEATAAVHERNAKGKHFVPRLIPVGHVEDGIVYNTCVTEELEISEEKAFLAIDITTNNFAPAYCLGDIILLENRFPKDHERAVFFDGVRAYFRLFLHEDNKYTLKCLNGRGQDMIFSRMDKIQCIGTCIGVYRG
ncbi:MAG: helix-turn-helix transcriptional regulator [Fusicatenibacter sp.]|nr:helix-turn-helix transcriptional regulator [Lachnospiraceae bacterium]MDY2938404.1 helix-turn-helix transcriptional regulator [Fusicatenibacter sp.]